MPSQTIIGPITTTKPAVMAAPIVEIKQLWADDWIVDPTLELVSMVEEAGSRGPGSCELRRRYGKIKGRSAAAFAVRDPVNLLNWWVQVQLVGRHGPEIAFIGRISTVTRNKFGSYTEGGITYGSGVQTFLAHGPLGELDKISVATSVFMSVVGSGTPVPVEERICGWVPDVNGRDEYGWTVGNRTELRYLPGGTQDAEGQFTYGGTSNWSYYDYLEYILARFADQGDVNAPSYSLGETAAILRDITASVEMGDTQTVGEILRRLIRPEYGLDFKLIPVPAEPVPGFELHVFSLIPEDQVFADVTIPKNSEFARLDLDAFGHASQLRLVETLDRQYDRIRVVGERMVICCTLRADGAAPTLVKKWGETLEALYDAGTGTPTDDPEQHDQVRAQERFAMVYAAFGAPDHFDPSALGLAPLLNAYGAVLGVNAAAQNRFRNTLGWLPLLGGMDYRFDPPTITSDPDFKAGARPPAAWVYDPEGDPPGYRLVEKIAGVSSLAALSTEWGLEIRATPNHVLARNHFAAAAESALDPDEKGVDYMTLAVTIAFHADQRLAMTYEARPAGETIVSELVIPVRGAEFWWLAPNTVVGVDNSGLLQTSGNVGRVLRNDASRIALVMAGAILRYALSRTRAEVQIEGLWNWGTLVGRILKVMERGHNVEGVYTPITSVTWHATDKAATIIGAGYAM